MIILPAPARLQSDLRKADSLNACPLDGTKRLITRGVVLRRMRCRAAALTAEAFA
jgi:hypothetical protein